MKNSSFFNIRFSFPRELRRGSLLLNWKAVTDEEFYSSIHYMPVARHKFENTISIFKRLIFTKENKLK